MRNFQPIKKAFLNRDTAYLFAVLLFSIFICRPILSDDFINTIDGGSHLLHLYCMAQFIGQDQWFVRWIPHQYGYGYPVFNFYPPLFSILGTALVKTGFSYVLALNLTCFFIVLCSGTAMYFLAKEFWGPEGGFLSALAYIIAPYLMLNIYARGAYPETLSFPFLPLILWGFFKLNNKFSLHYILIASLAIAGLFLSHNCITMIFCPIVLLYILVLNLPLHPKNLPAFFISLATLALGIGLASFFWLPAILEKNLVHIDKIVTGSLDFHNSFLSLKQLIYAPWPKKPGTVLPYEIGPVHCLLALITLCSAQRIVKGRIFLIQQIIFFFFIFASTIFMTLPPSLIVWEHIPILKFLSFSSRFLVIITLAVSILAGGVTLLFSPRHRLMVMLLGVLALFLVNSSRCQAPYGANKVNFKNVDPSFVFTRIHAQDTGEYLPQWVKVIRSPIPTAHLEIIRGEGQILSQNTASEIHQTFRLSALTPSLLCFNVFYFPGWTIKVDGHSVDIFKDNPFGLMFFPVDAGVHEIKADFGPTLVRRVALAISVISLLILSGLIFFKILSLCFTAGHSRSRYHD